MLGILIAEREKEEMIFLLKREMDEILFDLRDERIEHIVKRSMKERYQILFSLFKRLAPHKECLNYMLPTTEQKTTFYNDK